MQEFIKQYLVSPENLHPEGDWCGASCRLPEFQVDWYDSGHRKHPLHIVGRYLLCQIHDHNLAKAMSIQSDTPCSQLKQNWHSVATRFLDQGLINIDFASRHKKSSLRRNPKLAAIAACICATQVQYANSLQPDIDIAWMVQLLSCYPHPNFDWLQDIPDLDIDPLLATILVAEKHPELAPTLARPSTRASSSSLALYAAILRRSKEDLAKFFTDVERNYPYSNKEISEWQKPLITTLQQARPELFPAEVVQLIEGWNREAHFSDWQLFKAAIANPAMIQAVSYWQDRGWTVTEAVSEIAKIAPPQDTFTRPIPPPLHQRNIDDCDPDGSQLRRLSPVLLDALPGAIESNACSIEDWPALQEAAASEIEAEALTL